MLKFKILVEGYAKEIKGKEHASSTCTLIQAGKVNIIIDPGHDRLALLRALKKENLSLEKVHYVVLTHSHLDHFLLAGIFINAEVWDSTDAFSWDGKIEPHGAFIPNTKIKIIATPGHDPFHCSILVTTKEQGKVVVAGDLFWWKTGEKPEKIRAALLNHKDPYVKDGKALFLSRKKILALADYIIPGHGKIFKVPEK